MPPPIPSVPRSQRYSIVCEGEHDKSFFAELCSEWNIDHFHVDQSGGNSKFGAHLDGLFKATATVPLEAVLIVGDNDDDTNRRFKEIQDQIDIASKTTDFVVPEKPFELAAKNKNSVGTVVMMIPFDHDMNPINGCLESILMEAVDHSRAHLLPHIEEFKRCVEGNDWKISRRDKMRFVSLIAAACRKPLTSVTLAVRKSENLIDFSHASLTVLVEFLEKFESWLAEQRLAKFG